MPKSLLSHNRTFPGRPRRKSAFGSRRRFETSASGLKRKRHRSAHCMDKANAREVVGRLQNLHMAAGAVDLIVQINRSPVGRLVGEVRVMRLGPIVGECIHYSGGLI